MERRWLKVLILAAIAAGAAACSDRSAPVAPRAPAPSTVAPQLRASGGSYYIGDWQLLLGRGPTQTKIAIMDERGGKMAIGGSSLVVPANALSGATLLTFTLQAQPFIQAKLYALSLEGRTRGTLVTTFPVALTLTLSYADAVQQPQDPTQMKMAWMENGVLMGFAPSRVDLTSKKLIGDLKHFSEYQPSVPGDLTSPPGIGQ